jgi:hypothetical protein
VLRWTLLQALKRHVKDAHLPLLASSLLGTVMARCKRRGSELAVKRTAWRKFGAFLAAMEADGLLGLAHGGAGGAGGGDGDGDSEAGALSVVSVNRAHEQLAGFRPWPVAEEDGAAAGAALTEDDGAEGPASARRPTIVLRTLHSPQPCLAPIVRTVLQSEAAALTAAAAATPLLAALPPTPLLAAAVELSAVKRGDGAALECLFHDASGKGMGSGAWSTALPPPDAFPTPHAFARFVSARAGEICDGVSQWGWPAGAISAVLAGYIAHRKLAAARGGATASLPPGHIVLDLALAEALTGKPGVDCRADAAGGGRGGVAADAGERGVSWWHWGRWGGGVGWGVGGGGCVWLSISGARAACACRRIVTVSAACWCRRIVIARVVFACRRIVAV